SFHQHGVWARLRNAAHARPGLAFAVGLGGLAGLVVILMALGGLFSGWGPTPAGPAIEPAFVLGTEDGRHWGPATCVAYSPDGKLLASAGHDKVVRVWDAATLRERYTLKGHTDRVNAVAFAGDSQHIISGGDDQVLRLWDLGQPDREPD